MQVGWKQKLAILVAITVVFIAAVAPIGAQDKPFLEPDKQLDRLAQCASLRARFLDPIYCVGCLGWCHRAISL